MIPYKFPSRFRQRCVPRFLMLAALPLAIGCSSVSEQLADIVFVPHQRSAAILGEGTRLELIYAEPGPEDPRSPPERQTESKELVAAVAPVLIGAALDQVEKGIEAESKRYTATYSATNTHLNNTDDSKELVGLWFERCIGSDGTGCSNSAEDSDTGRKTAMRFCAAIRGVKSAPRKLLEIWPVATELRYSKAKVVAFSLLSPFGVDLLNPWEALTDWLSNDPPSWLNDDDVDLSIQLVLKGLSLAQVPALKIQESELTTQTFLTRAARLTSSSDTNAADAYKSGERCGSLKEFAELAATLSKSNDQPARYFPHPPAVDGAEIVSATVTVTEFDDFGARVKEYGKTFKENRNSIGSTIGDAFTGPP